LPFRVDLPIKNGDLKIFELRKMAIEIVDLPIKTGDLT
jgi:hypothetical protein